MLKTTQAVNDRNFDRVRIAHFLRGSVEEIDRGILVSAEFLASGDKLEKKYGSKSNSVICSIICITVSSIYI